MMQNVFSTSYFPNIEYLQKIVRFSKLHIENHEFYQRHSYRNKTKILGSNGTIFLTVPIRKNKSKTIINQTQIADQNWQKKHLKSIQSAYGSSPFFIYYYSEIEQIINQKHNYLIDLNNLILEYINNTLNLNLTIYPTQEYKHTAQYRDRDFRFDNLKSNTTSKIVPYQQVIFKNNHKIKKIDFYPNLSFLDLLFNLGPNTHKYLHDLQIK